MDESTAYQNLPPPICGPHLPKPPDSSSILLRVDLLRPIVRVVCERWITQQIRHEVYRVSPPQLCLLHHWFSFNIEEIAFDAKRIADPLWPARQGINLLEE